MIEEMKTVRCPNCGAENAADAKFCAFCGEPMPEQPAAEDKPILTEDPMAAQGAVPKTINDLKAWTMARRMPLERMRFFIGEDYRRPKAFGIFEDRPDHFTVYKNKADGSRAVRYSGPDEAYAVKEIYQKLLSECHARGIHPERAGGSDAGSNAETEKMERAFSSGSRSRGRKTGGRATAIFLILAVAVIIAILIFSAVDHSHDGYYKRRNGSVYYRYGSDYYAYSDTVNDWISTVFYSDADEFLGGGYSGSYGVSDFRSSDKWDEINKSGDYDSDYDDWDFGDTDWDSDW